MPLSLLKCTFLLMELFFFLRAATLCSTSIPSFFIAAFCRLASISTFFIFSFILGYYFFR